jgi:hypothetical protein
MNIAWVLLFLAVTGVSENKVSGLADWKLQADYQACQESAAAKRAALRAEYPSATITVQCFPVATSEKQPT